MRALQTDVCVETHNQTRGGNIVRTVTLLVRIDVDDTPDAETDAWPVLDAVERILNEPNPCWNGSGRRLNRPVEVLLPEEET